jgi:hypothetical protein
MSVKLADIANSLASTDIAGSTDYYVYLQSTDGLTDYKILKSALKTGLSGWVKYTKAYTAWTAAPADSVEIGTDIIPAGGVVTGVKIKHSAAFTGGAISKVVAQIIDANNRIYIGDGSNYPNIFGAPAATAGDVFPGKSRAADPPTIPSQSAASKLYCTLTFTGAGRAALTTGSIDIWVKIETVV